jgi:hypothetical protein
MERKEDGLKEPGEVLGRRIQDYFELYDQLQMIQENSKRHCV